MCRPSCGANPSLQPSPSPSSEPSSPATSPSCKPALFLMRHAEDEGSHSMPGPDQVCGKGPTAPRYNMDSTGTQRRRLVRENLDKWVESLGACPITSISTVDPCCNGGSSCKWYCSTVNPWWTIEGYANTHCSDDISLDYIYSSPLSGDPAISPGVGGGSRVVTYTSQGLWSSAPGNERWNRPYPDSGTILREAYHTAGDERSRYDICAPSHSLVWVFTDYQTSNNKWGKLDQYITPEPGCSGSCPLSPANKARGNIWCWK